MAKQLPLKSGSAKDFSGGPNLRDASSEIGQNEVVDSWNVTFDERGGVSSRLGSAKYNSSVFAAGTVKNVFYSGILDTVVTQAGNKIYYGTSTTDHGTFATDDRVSFAEFNGRVYVGHPVDGLYYTTDGLVYTNVAGVDADVPATVAALAVWQNKLWLVPVNSDSVYWSAAGDGSSWDPTHFNALREKDNEPIVALHISSGQDILGRPGLLAFKQESTYRINNSESGAYDTVDATVGAASNIAVTGVGPKVLAIGKHGVFVYEEGQAGMTNVSDRFAPLWDPARISLSRLDQFCAGRKGTRARFSLPRAGSTANDLAIEYHPEQGWLAPGSNAASCYATSTGASETLYGGSPTVSGQVYELDTGGDDDGTAIAWRVQTRWFELNDGFLASVWQIRLHGRGSGTLTLLRDYEVSGGDEVAFSLTGDLILYDSGLHYDTGEAYSVPVFQTTEALYSIGVCRQLSMLFSGSATTTASAPQVLGAGTAPSIGEFGLYGIEWLHVPLGLS